MKQIQLNNKKYQIPESWKEVTLKQQILVSEIAHQEKYVKTLGILAGYTGIPVEELKTAKFNDVERVMKHLTFLNEEIPEDAISEFEYDGHTYFLIQNLLEQQFQDFVSIQTALSENENHKWKATPYILAVMAKRDGETLDDFNIRERAEMFENIDVVTANRVAAFFLSNSKVLKSIMMYSSPEAQLAILQNKIEELKISLNRLKKHRGGNLLIRLWIMISRKWIAYLEKQLVKSYSLQPSNNSKKKWKAIFKKLQCRKQKTKNLKV